MAGINFIGSYSGIDRSMIDQLMEAERMPLVQLSNKKVNISAKQNAWKDVNTRLNSLFEKLKALQSPGTFTTMKTKSSDDSSVSMTASKDAVAGSYKIQVEQLATSTRIIGGQIDNIYDEDGRFKALNLEGSFTIKNHDYVEGEEEDIANIIIGKNDTLKDIVNRINDETKNTGVNATIIDRKIVLTDEKTGNRNIELSNVEGIVLNHLKLTGVEVDKGDIAKFTINGIEATSNSNTVKDLVLGLTINLNKAHNGTYEGKGEDRKFISSEYDTITVSTDTEKLTKTVQDFVDQYNSTMKFIEEQLAPGTVTDDGTTGRGTLAGDSSLRSLHDSLRRMVTETLGGNDGTTIKDISALGVSTTDKSGVLSFDSSKLLEEFSKDSQNVINFFSHEVKKGDEKVNVGFVSKLNEKIDSYISSRDGLIKSKNESYDKTIKDLNNQIDRFNDRMERKEEYYVKMFSALDVAMMQAESQMSWLEGQISAMNSSMKK